MPEPEGLPERGSILGFDFGLARIGVAVGELESGTAHALATIEEESGARRFERIAALLSEWHPVGLVVGLPSHPDGTEHELSRRCRRFAHQLYGRYGLPVRLVDERYSSVEASQALAGAGRRGHHAKRSLDAVAALIILQDFLDNRAHAH